MQYYCYGFSKSNIKLVVDKGIKLMLVVTDWLIFKGKKTTSCNLPNGAFMSAKGT